MTVVQVWAPHAHRVQVGLDEATIDLTARDGGWWTGPDLAPGTRYWFLLDDCADRLPDPASRRLPCGVHGPSAVYDQGAYRWHDGAWRGRDLTRAVVYELHVGTFTRGATFASAIERLDHLAGLGVTHVELLPVNAFGGMWNWGYDGVGWYAVHEPYGGPDGLKSFVDACHARGLAVVLDVVYNHLGPEGNYLPRFGPYLMDSRNEWGEHVDFDQAAVRSFVIDNALMWLRDFHVDALRVDAIHAVHDASPTHVLADLSAAVDTLAGEVGRPLTLIAESDLNDPIVITPRSDGGYGFAAQWDDDVHHALHALVTGERQGYYCDFGSLQALAKTMTSAFVHDGTYSTFRGRHHGRPVDRSRHEAWRFVMCLQNHDQVGNRAAGERLPELTSPGLLRVAAVLLLTGPYTPMLWMGEEWAASTRWPFFTSHEDAGLAAATGPGRVAEFARHGWDVSTMVDPQDPRAYREAVLDWDELAEPAHAAVLDLYRRLIALRAAEPDLTDPDLSAVAVDFDEDARWVSVRRGSLLVLANLAPHEQAVPAAASEIGAVVLATGAARVGDTTVSLAGETAVIVRLALRPAG